MASNGQQNPRVVAFFGTQAMNRYVQSIERPATGDDPAAATTAAATTANGDAFVHVSQIPRGLGRWEWLQKKDFVLALAQGYNNQQGKLYSLFSFPSLVLAFRLYSWAFKEVELARGRNELGLSFNKNAGPITVFFPDPRFHNPAVQPAIPGHWEFLTTGQGFTEEYAQMQFAGTDFFPWADPNHPTAGEIWQVRQQMNVEIRQGARDENITNDIHLVFVPDGPVSPLPSPQASRESSPESDSDSDKGPSVGHRLGQLDPNSGLLHEPRNRGENDQTGTETAQYHTRLIRGKKYTIDRSRLAVNRPEPHKCWIVTKYGVWRTREGSEKVNWANEKEVEQVNKWKEQQLGRDGWPKKREARKGYTREEKKWMWAKIAEVAGRRPTEDVQALTSAFNARFGAKREWQAIVGWIDRLCAEYKKHGGQMK
jgi:hypothetical protein